MAPQLPLILFRSKSRHYAALRLMLAITVSFSFVYSSPGGLDLSFGSGGRVISSFGNFNDSGLAVAVQPDGKILVAGYHYQIINQNSFGLSRFNADGSIDTSFGSNGKVLTQVPGWPNCRPFSIAVQVDGKIVVAGDAMQIPSMFNPTISRFVAARYDANGILDGSFDGDGIAIVQIASENDAAYGVTIQDDGKIILAGHSSGRPALARLDQNGSLDVSFDSDGKVLIDREIEFVISDVELQNDGKIVVAGNGSLFNGTGDGLIASRFASDGSLDLGFGEAGLAFLSPSAGGIDVGTSVAIDRQGRIVLGGYTTTLGPPIDPSLVRLRVDGSVDLSFGNNGLVREPASTTIGDIAIQTDGKIIAVGGKFGDSRAVASRYHSDGRLDRAFGEAGTSFTQVANSAAAGAVALRPDGKIVVAGTASVGQGSSDFFVARYHARTSFFDHDGDTRADLSVRRPSDNIWYLLQGTAGFTAITWSEAGDKLAPADYDGDGKSDVAVFRPSTGQWYVVNSSNLTFVIYNWGQDGDLPVPTDRDNDGRSDLVLFRPSNNTWYPRSTATGPLTPTQFGEAGDKPMVGDFDADGIGDIALFRPSNNNWYIIKSSLGYFVQTWGEAGDIPTTGDFDGDGATDQAVFRPSTGQWFLSRTTAGFSSQFWGQNGDIPVAADYDGDGKTDVAVFRPSNATWYIVNSTTGIQITQFGVTGDVPTPSAFIY